MLNASVEIPHQSSCLCIVQAHIPGARADLGGGGQGVGSPLFSSAVPPGSGTFQMPTRPSSSSASASTLRGERANLRNASVIFSLFWHEASLG